VLALSTLLLLLAPTAALKLPSSIAPPTARFGRRAALAAAAVALTPQLASAKYRPTLADSKGFGNSPYTEAVDAQKTVQSSLSHAQLVANSKKMQEEMIGRSLDEDEMKELEAKITKFYPDAK